MRGHISKDHVHLFVAIPLKGKSSHALMMAFPSLQKQYWGRHMWARGYFCCSSGNVTDEAIRNYIEQQTQLDEEFKIDE
jgi:putative transposase